MQQHANHLPSTTGIREQPTSATNHPLASAIVDAPKERGNRFGEARDFGSSVGKGVGGSVEGRKLATGSHRIMAEAEVELSALAVEVERLRVQGATAIFVAIDRKSGRTSRHRRSDQGGGSPSDPGVRQAVIRITSRARLAIRRRHSKDNRDGTDRGDLWASRHPGLYG
ncbi:hypothetical protein ACFSKM_00870 [Ancylobacter dichloromethanicus]